MPDKDFAQNYIVELRRGSLTMGVLCALYKPHYGYSLLQTLQAMGLSIEANTLYPLLRRLEVQGLLTSSWDVSESRPRKYYCISSKGGEVLQALLEEWKRMNASIEEIYKRGQSDE